MTDANTGATPRRGECSSSGVCLGQNHGVWTCPCPAPDPRLSPAGSRACPWPCGEGGCFREGSLVFSQPALRPFLKKEQCTWSVLLPSRPKGKVCQVLEDSF